MPRRVKTTTPLLQLNTTMTFFTHDATPPTSILACAVAWFETIQWSICRRNIQQIVVRLTQCGFMRNWCKGLAYVWWTGWQVRPLFHRRCWNGLFPAVNEHYPIFALNNLDVFESPDYFASDVFVEHGGFTYVREEVVIFLGNTSLHIVVYIETSFPYTLSVSVCHWLRQCPPELLVVEVGYKLFEEGLVHLEESLAQDDKLSSGLFLCFQLGRIIMNANFGINKNFSTSDGVLAGLAKWLVDGTGLYSLKTEDQES